MPIEELLPYFGKSRSPERMADQIFDWKLLNSRFRTWKSYYFELTCIRQKSTSTVKINKCNKTANINVKKLLV